ncbi:MAG: hypothetical protein M3537_06460, partial [Chloroflexota bacterium]|nr:hypothetical protein [Chloroflexota bacterium]
MLPGGVARWGDGVGFGVLLTLDVLDVGRTGNVRRLLVVAVVCAVGVVAVVVAVVVAGVAAAAVRAEDVVASIAAGGLAPQPARTRQVSTPVVAVALVVLLRVMARSVHLVVWSVGWPASSLPWPSLAQGCVRGKMASYGYIMPSPL